MTRDELKANIPNISLGQIATVNLCPTGPSSIIEGQIDMISRRGINILTEHGTTFIKWDNVIKVNIDL